jgi:hypothetical protein
MDRFPGFIRNRAVLAILTASVIARLVTVFMKGYGIPIWPQGIPGPSLWGDYNTLYLLQLARMAQGYLLYRDIPYNYGPLFLYSMYPLYLIIPKLAFLPIVISDALTAPMICLALKGGASRRVAVTAGLVYALSPFFLVDEGYLWLSSQPLALALVCSVYFYNRKKPFAAVISLVIAILFKPEGIFLVPPLAVACVWQYRARAMKYISAGIALAAGVSAPFLILAPVDYISSLTYEEVKLGIPEPSRLPGNFFGAGSGSTVSASCGPLTIAHVYTGAFCGTVLNLGQFEQYLAFARIYAFIDVLCPVLFCVFAVGLLAIRGSDKLFQISCVFSLLGGLLLFSTFAHGSLGYYFVPVYAILLLSSTSAGALVAVALGIELVTFLPEGPLQFLVPLLMTFAIVVLESRRIEQRNLVGNESINATPRISGLGEIQNQQSVLQ